MLSLWTDITPTTKVPYDHLPTSPSLTSPSGSMDIDSLNVGKIVQVASSKEYIEDDDEQISKILLN